MPTPVVVDLSHHNVIPESLKPAKAAGIVGVIHKMSEGASYVDSKVAARWSLAKDAGMAWGLYHFIRPGDPIAQANFFLDRAAVVSDEQTLLALDWEDKGVSADKAVQFLAQVEARSGRAPVLYSGHVCKEDPDVRLAPYRLWLAQYASSCTLPSFASSYWLWQFSESGKVAGITPPTDLNHYDGPVERMLSEWSGGAPAPIPVPPEPGVVITYLKIRSSGPITVEVVPPDVEF